MKTKMYILLILLYSFDIVLANSTFPSQTENPIANFSLNEDDTTRYSHHHLSANRVRHLYDTFLGFHFIYDKTKARTEDGEDRWIGNQEETISIIYENIMRAKYKIEGRKEYYGKSTYKKL